jgi:hypothetical protein
LFQDDVYISHATIWIFVSRWRLLNYDTNSLKVG